MNTYIIKRQVTLTVEGKDRKEAIKNSQAWEGETWSASTLNGVIEWNGKSKLLSAKIKKDQP